MDLLLNKWTVNKCNVKAHKTNAQVLSSSTLNILYQMELFQTVRKTVCVIGNEKWILYNNIEQKKSQNKTPKASLHPKVMLYIWWNWKGVLYYKLLPENQIINSNKYWSQLDQLKAALNKKHLESVNRKHNLPSG